MTSPAKNRERALALLARGFTRDDVARKLGVSERTVYRWQRAASAVEAPDPASTTAPQPVATPAPSASPAAGDDADILDIARGIITEQKAIAQLAKQDGNTTAAARALKSAGDATNLVARLEQRRKADTDVVTIPRADVERIGQAMRERVAALAADLARTGGLVCSACGRNLRLQLAKEGL